MIPTIIEYEARRQQSLLEIKEQLGTDYIVVSDPIDVTEHFKGGKGFIKNALTKGKAIGVRVEGFKGVFGKELCPGYRVGTEFADIAKTWGFGGVIHSDEDMNKYGIDVGDAFELNANDAFIVLLGNPKRINKLIDTLFVPRIQQFLNGVPQEVRKANANGTTSYLRPVPGAARMYPETDIPVVEIDHSKTEAPKLLTERAEDLVKETGLSNDLVKEILAKNIPITEYKKEYPALDYAFLSSALVEWPREIASRLKKDVPHTAYVEPLLGDVASGKLAKSSVKAILEQAVQNDIPATEVPKLMAKYEQLPLKKLNKIINDVVENNKGAPLKALMGLVMKEVHGKADGKLVMQLLEEKHARSL